MLDAMMILWLPLAIAGMAITWVLTLGALGQQPVRAEERRLAPGDE